MRLGNGYKFFCNELMVYSGGWYRTAGLEAASLRLGIGIFIKQVSPQFYIGHG
jgi:hypothetical protein